MRGAACLAESSLSHSTAEGAERVRLRRTLGRALEQAQPESRVLAQGILAEASPIDLLAVGAEGELIAIRMAEPGDDLATLTRLLADLAWLRPRREDFLKLANGSGIDPSAEPRGLLVAPSMGRETRAAVDNFPANTIQLWLGRPGREGDRATLRIERIDPTERTPDLARSRRSLDLDESERPETTKLPGPVEPPASLLHSRLPAAPPPSSSTIPTEFRRTTHAAQADHPARPLIDPPSPSAFRTGLCAADLVASESPTGDHRSR